MAQTPEGLRKKNEDRFMAVLRDECALIKGYKCPICGHEFRDQDACTHGWADVKKTNDKWLRSYLRTRAMV